MSPASAVPGANVMIGTPAYGGMVHTDYLKSLFGFVRAGIRFDLVTIGNESLITRARNSVLAAFHARPEFTHLLFLDADVHLPADGLSRMLAAAVPVVGAPVALKGRTPAGDRLWNVGRCVGSRGALFVVEHVGTAALLFTRGAVDALVADAIADGRTYAPAENVVGHVASAVHFDVFQVGVRDGQYLSEDYWACQRLVALGFEICVDAAVVTTHHGIVAV